MEGGGGSPGRSIYGVTATAAYFNFYRRFSGVY